MTNPLRRFEDDWEKLGLSPYHRAVQATVVRLRGARFAATDHFNHHLVKPVDFEQLVRLLAEVAPENTGSIVNK